MTEPIFMILFLNIFNYNNKYTTIIIAYFEICNNYNLITMTQR